MQDEGVGTSIPSAWRGISASLFVIGLVFLIYGIVKWIRPKPLFKVPAEVEVITELPMPGGKKVILARVLDRCYLLGLTKDGITLLDRVENLDKAGEKPLDTTVIRREVAEVARERVLAVGKDIRLSGGYKAPAKPAVAALGTYSPFINKPGVAKRAVPVISPAKPFKTQMPTASSKHKLRMSSGDSARKEYLLGRIRSEIERLS